MTIGPVPANYDAWRHCIEVDCAQPLTAAFIAQRLAALRTRATTTPSSSCAAGEHSTTRRSLHGSSGRGSNQYRANSSTCAAATDGRRIRDRPKQAGVSTGLAVPAVRTCAPMHRGGKG